MNYVGVTGPVTVDEAVRLNQSFLKYGFSQDASHIGMAGYLVSTNSIAGKQMKTPRYPLFNLVPDMIRATKDCLNMLHYTTLPRFMHRIRDDIEKAFKTEGIYEQGLCRALQLNLEWPDPAILDDTLDMFPEMEIVLSVNPRDMDADQIAEKVKRYKGLAKYALIDPSQGRGKPIDLELAARIYDAIKDMGMSIGFAGAFGGQDTEEKLIALIDRIYETFNIDGERVLRTPDDKALDFGKVDPYLADTSRVL